MKLSRIAKEVVERSLELMDNFCDQLDSSYTADRILKGSLCELKIHYLLRITPKIYCTDIDFVTTRFNEPTSLIELKTGDSVLGKWQKSIYLFIAEKCNIPFYLLRVINLDKFIIERIDKEEDILEYNLLELSEWYQSLSLKIDNIV